MQQAEASVPLYAVPKSKGKKKQDGEEKNTPTFEEIPTDLVNEQGVPCGKFGWCVACRGTANLYCKHTRYPVCSFECK